MRLAVRGVGVGGESGVDCGSWGGGVSFSTPKLLFCGCSAFFSWRSTHMEIAVSLSKKELKYHQGTLEFFSQEVVR